MNFLDVITELNGRLLNCCPECGSCGSFVIQPTEKLHGYKISASCANCRRKTVEIETAYDLEAVNNAVERVADLWNEVEISIETTD